jgi:hypothetical protein
MLFETEEQIRHRITRRFRRWMLFFAQIFLTIPFGLFTTNLFRYSPGFKGLLLGSWFAILFIHGLYLFMDTIKEWAIRHEIERQQRLSAGFGIKQKRGNRLSLGEDGELLDSLGVNADDKEMSTY